MYYKKDRCVCKKNNNVFIIKKWVFVKKNKEVFMKKKSSSYEKQMYL